MAQNYSQLNTPRLQICFPCFEEGMLGPFATTIHAIRHVVLHHQVTYPPIIQFLFVQEDITTIGLVVNDTVGRNLHQFTIAKPSQIPTCHACQISLPSWEEAICHQIGRHQNSQPWEICQMMGSDLMVYVPQMMKKFKFKCFHCQGQPLFQIQAMLTFHYKVFHKMSEVDAQTYTNLQENKLIFDNIKKEVIEGKVIEGKI